jgi:hypothetical protein
MLLKKVFADNIFSVSQGACTLLEFLSRLTAPIPPFAVIGANAQQGSRTSQGQGGNGRLSLSVERYSERKPLSQDTRVRSLLKQLPGSTAAPYAKPKQILISDLSLTDTVLIL